MAVLKDLIVHGASRFINGIQANTVNAESVGAELGIFNKLIATTLEAKEATIDDLTATNATVVGLLDVQGQMQTNSWTNSNIATIDGSFYICPTISSEATVTTNGTTQTSNNKFVYNSSGGTIVLTGTWATTGSLYLDNSAVDWRLYSKVMITGEVLIGTEWTPIGTIRGILTGINTSSGTITIGSLSTNITVGSDGTINSAPAILSLVTSGTSYNARKLKVSLYEYNSTGTSSGSTNLIGIMMTTAGTHGFTYLDIYNGLNSKTSYTSTIDNTTTATEPKVRIGNLNGLPNIVEGSTNIATKPTGWGIYTDNGYFKGTIVADSGTIGNFTIANDLHSGTSGIGQDTNVYISSGTISNIDIAGSLIEPYQLTQDTSPQSGKTYYQYNTQNETYTSVTGTISGNPKELGYYELVDTNRSWAFTAGNSFGVTTGGELFANGATINGIVNIKNGSNVYTIQQVEQTIYGTVAYQYVHDGITETVYKRDDNTYYWIDSNEEEHIVDEINLEHDEVTGKLITIRLEDGFNASVNQIQNAVNSNTELIQTLSDSVDGQFENINGQFISIDEQFTGQITDINQTISTQQEYINNLSGYVTITSNNIQVGNLSSNSYVLIDGTNAKVSININDNEVAYMSGNRFYAPSAVVTNLYMKTEIGGNETGDIGWVMRSNGHLSLKRLK